LPKKQKVTAARQTFLNMKRIIPELAIREGEGGKEWRLRVEAWFCERWNCADSTLRHCILNKYPPSRSFSYQSNPGFFPDLKKFGAAKFDKDGKVVRDSLGKGMDRVQYEDERIEYRTLRAEIAKEDRRARARAA
jgi:hypothetical protein